MIGWYWMMNWKTCGTKWSWLNLKWYPVTYLTETKKILCHDCRPGGRLWSRPHPEYITSCSEDQFLNGPQHFVEKAHDCIKLAGGLLGNGLRFSSGMNIWKGNRPTITLSNLKYGVTGFDNLLSHFTYLMHSRQINLYEGARFESRSRHYTLWSFSSFYSVPQGECRDSVSN
jgi:hypothetical protein